MIICNYNKGQGLTFRKDFIADPILAAQAPSSRFESMSITGDENMSYLTLRFARPWNQFTEMRSLQLQQLFVL